ncbi:xanthine dehydrogenase molybdopterin binding subunit [Methylophaga sp.]|uniref:xanthine dehydrogenase molybdopterin binding subunit n=1 Tax=Methylophaga sp. TaxID=2024840 RepID=UPI002725DED2|nr:xanthine dehydrogenase molybdopterin binding subunit [Methylophaga sp.]MDO8826852.1 xanthine dehydrogenase molybdopterin binding subunit [Methylophaga sp.]
MRNLTDNLDRNKRQAKGVAGQSVVHESAMKQVMGKAEYIDDMAELPNTLHIAVGGSAHAHARISHLDLQAVRDSEGVVDVMTWQDIPGKRIIGAVIHDEELLVKDTVEYVGHPIFAVGATSIELALQAVQKAVVEYEVLPAIVDVPAAMANNSFVLPKHVMKMGQVETALQSAAHRITGELMVRGQEHFYLEGQACYVLPTEDGVHVHTSTQHPSEVQKMVAEVLDLPFHKVTAEVRRMGGGFGGKESQAAHLACIAALFTNKHGRPAKYRMVRRDDMVATGKRHDFLTHYDVAFDEQGMLQAVKMSLAGLCGYSADLSQGIVDRAMFHADNAYYLNNAEITGLFCKTHTVSNTAFRGFGGPQGMAVIEAIMDRIAVETGEDPLTIRKRNLYCQQRNQTHYGQTVEQHILHDMMEQLEQSSDYWARRHAINAFNKSSRYVKKGMALTPVKFGISFTVKHLNQAGALVNIYTDGSINVNHGGTEMGQGLYTKVAQIVANEFQVDLEKIMVTSTRTDKVPNTSPTAASSGSDLNGKAAQNACINIKARLVEFAAEHFGLPAQAILFVDNQVLLGEASMPFAEFVQLAYTHRVQLSSTGFYKTPTIHYDRETGKGKPYFYFAHGVACSEVQIDTLTGEYKVTRVDLLHDVGKSLSPGIDIGQIEGGFVQGMGWVTSEELLWNDKGHLLSNAPANYKIPTAFDVPEAFHVKLYKQDNHADTIYSSKAVGEPPLMLALSVWCALRDACGSVAEHKISPYLPIPATPEQVLWAVESAQQAIAQ